MEQKESFVFYRGFREAINALPQEYQLKTMQYLMDYAFDGIEPEENGVEKALFLSFKPQIDASQKRYQAVVMNGQKGGRPKKENTDKNKQKLECENQSESKHNQCTEKQNQQKPNTNPNDNVNDNENENDNENVNENDNNNDNVNSPKEEKGVCVFSHSLEYDKELKTIRDSFVFPEALHNKINDWLTYKKEKQQSYKPKGLQSLLSQMQNQYAQHGEQAVISVIDMSMANNYEGILWSKIAEKNKIQCYENSMLVSQTKQKPQKYGDIL